MTMPGQSKLEKKLDDLMTLLSAQATQDPNPGGAEQNKMPTPSASSISISTDSPSSSSVAAAPAIPHIKAPDVLIDMNSTSVVQLLRPSKTEEAKETSIIHSDIEAAASVNQITGSIAEKSLARFREAFILTFPAVHIPEDMTAGELRAHKPFLWLVIMALTAKDIAVQFALEETVWSVISRRVVVQQCVSLDLLLGVVCFAAWSHYFKQDRPFMTMLAQVAVAMAFEIGLQKDVAATSTKRTGSATNKSQLRYQARPERAKQVRTLEERRSILAVFHLTSASWTSYRKTEPLRWTRYLDRCLSVLAEGQETKLDILLATQVRCQIITNSLTCLQLDEDAREEVSNVPSKGLITAMLGRLNDLRQSLPEHILSDRIAQFYLTSAETTILESFLSIPQSLSTTTGRSTTATAATSNSRFRRLQDLESILTSVERWLSLFLDMPLAYWPGITMDTFSQFTHSLVVLFRLSTHDEPSCGWDRNEVRQRADVFAILDLVCERMEAVPAYLGQVNAEGPRSGLFFKTTYLLRAIKSLFAAETRDPSDQDAEREGSAAAFKVTGGLDLNGPEAVTTQDMQDATFENADVNFSLANEPWWLTDLLNIGPSWDVGPEELSYTPYVEY
ncbi:hypothetical protein BD289DRAFT_262295 [Coniella lustricola]|uniref:Transcription factor domain-containing protein n=1 Tax=Coniella lustricola TaxID=2025994 RepID=A0A2T3A7L8_9PEZI|nr:hypothetical protein BD289DRAFT_262295 [Coniella lustricola]